jgi:hypothetical protein
LALRLKEESGSVSIRRQKLEQVSAHPARRTGISVSALRCRRKFLRFFPNGFRDRGYYDWERGYKWEAHVQWKQSLDRATFGALLGRDKFAEIAARAVKVESKTNLLFSFEKMAIRDAVKPLVGARLFAEGLYDFLHGPGGAEAKFQRWCETVGMLPRKQTRVLTWPVVTVFGFLAQPERHIYLKPNVTRIAAVEYGFDFQYQSRPSMETYASLLEFAHSIRSDLRDLEPQDMIDIQSFIWVQGSDEFEER